MEEASQQAIETLQLMDKLVETINWKLDCTAIHVDTPTKEIGLKNS